MNYRTLGRSGLKVPELCFGTGTFGGANDFFKSWGSTQDKEAAHLIDICMEAGCNFFDTADIYSDGHSESVLGKAIAHLRRDRRPPLHQGHLPRLQPRPQQRRLLPLPPHPGPRRLPQAPQHRLRRRLPPPRLRRHHAPSTKPSAPSTTSSAKARSATSPAPTSPAGTS